MRSKLFISKTHLPTLEDHPDHYSISPSDSGSIGIKEIRTFNEWTHLKPFNKTTKVGLLVNFHTATTEAQNALLKTLEEPTDNTEIFVHTDDAQNLLTTVVSRCELIMRPEELLIEGLSWQLIESLSHISDETAQFFTCLTTDTTISDDFALVEKIAKFDRPDLLSQLDLLILQTSNNMKLESSKKVKVSKALLRTKELISQNVNAKLALEHAILSIK